MTAVSGQEERRNVDGVTLQVFRGGQGPTLLVLHDCEVMTEWQPYHAALGADRMKLPGAPGVVYEELLTLIRNREAAARFTWKPFMHNPALRRWLHRIAVPTVVLWGESDRIVRPDYGRALQQAIPGARFQLIPAAGHYPYLERPDEFVAAVTTFLS